MLFTFYLSCGVAVVYIIYIVVRKSHENIGYREVIYTVIGNVALNLLLMIDIWDVLSGSAIFYALCYIKITLIRSRGNWILWIFKSVIIVSAFHQSYRVLY